MRSTAHEPNRTKLSKPRATVASKPESSREWIRGLFLLVMTFVAYQRVWNAGFIWDDDNFLLNNPLIHQRDGLYKFWFTTSAPDYFPMTSSILWLEWRFWGENPLGYHLVNVALHVCSAVLWWRVLTALRIPGAWLAAALFALHPVNVESVAWITERKNTLAMFFYVGSLLTFLKFERNGHRGAYFLSVGLFLLALLSKTAVVMLPFVLLGLAWWQRGRIDRKDILRSVPFFAVALVLGLVTIWFQYNRAIGPDTVRADSLVSRMAGAGWAIWFYAYKALVPLNLSFVYPRWHINTANVLSYLPTLLVLVGLALVWVFRKGWGRAWLATFGYFVLMLLPVLGFLNVYFMRYSLVADHWQYFSLIAPMALVAAGIVFLSNRLKEWHAMAGPGVKALLLIVCGLLTWNQCAMYRDVESLWRRTIQLNPGSAMAQNALGDVYLAQGKLEEAVARFQRATDLDPQDPLACNNLAIALMRQRRPAEALATLEKGLAIKPSRGEPQNNLAWLLATSPFASVRNGERAVTLALEADRLSGGTSGMFTDTLAAAYAEKGDFTNAVLTAQRAINLAGKQNDIALAETIAQRMELYERRAPFRDQGFNAQ